MSGKNATWRAALKLAMPVIVAAVTVSGCASADSSPKAAAAQATSQTKKHTHTPWRYRHMGHRHTRPNLGSGNPIFPECAACQSNSEEANPDAS